MSEEVIKQIEALDARRCQAVIAKDAQTLAEVMAEDMIYVHGSATAETRQQYIERSTTGFYDYKSLKTLRRDFRVYGDVVLVNGDMHIDVVVKGSAKEFVTRYLQVWARRNSKWQMVSWQSTPVPAGA